MLQAGTVCEEGFSDAAAAVVCKELGYYENTAYWITSNYTSSSTWDIQESYPIMLDNVNCSEENVSFSDCNIQGAHNCVHSEDVFLMCAYRQGESLSIL